MKAMATVDFIDTENYMSLGVFDIDVLPQTGEYLTLTGLEKYRVDVVFRHYKEHDLNPNRRELENNYNEVFITKTRDMLKVGNGLTIR